MSKNVIKLPFFVYGTLMSGFSNHNRLVAGKFERCMPAFVEGYDLDHLSFGFPGAYQAIIDTDDKMKNKLTANIIGELIWPLNDMYDTVLADLDKLEDIEGGMYRRITVDCMLNDETSSCDYVQAYMYECLLPRFYNDTKQLCNIPVTHGNWRQFCSEHNLLGRV